jgi:hypothetical protein
VKIRRQQMGDLATQAARELHQAIESKNQQDLIHNVIKHNNGFLQDVAAEYVKHYGKALPEAIKNAADGEYGVFLHDLVIPWADFAARTVHNAVTGAGTAENAIIDVIVHLSPEQVTALKAVYSQLFNRDLVDRIKNDTSGNFGKVIVNVLNGKHDAIGNYDEEASQLWTKGEGKWGTDDDYFVSFFTRHPWEVLQEINVRYAALPQNKHHHDLVGAIKNETSGHYQDILVALVQSRAVYWAHRIRHAIAGLGTDDTLLRRAFALNSHEQLREISRVYPEVNPNKTLRSDVADDTSGHYKETFLAIIDHVSR